MRLKCALIKFVFYTMFYIRYLFNAVYVAFYDVCIFGCHGKIISDIKIKRPAMQAKRKAAGTGPAAWLFSIFWFDPFTFFVVPD